MIYSMTAFSRQQLEQEWGSLTWEIRSVNHRYLEPNIRMPEQFRSLEPVIREAIRKQVNRGKIECQLRFQADQNRLRQIQLNPESLQQLKAASIAIRKTLPDTRSLSNAEILAWPGVIKEQEMDTDSLEKHAVTLFRQTLAELLAARAREGEELGQLIQQRLEAVNTIITEVRELLPDILKRQRDNLQSRLSELKAELEPGRLEQEIVLLAQKCDVDEELDRLDSHIGEVTRVLGAAGQKGRRLDFLMQELNREANTLSSKSVVAQTTRSAVELKVLIEQMREQIQNIE